MNRSIRFSPRRGQGMVEYSLIVMIKVLVIAIPLPIIIALINVHSALGLMTLFMIIAFLMGVVKFSEDRRRGLLQMTTAVLFLVSLYVAFALAGAIGVIATWFLGLVIYVVITVSAKSKTVA